uniref:(northern house mosquito) hypothetical protein n=1 Tax=Culex pipiens TaxID=7175 RepID=A0A8D8CR36_CULPI
MPSAGDSQRQRTGPKPDKGARRRGVSRPLVLQLDHPFEGRRHRRATEEEKAQPRRRSQEERLPTGSARHSGGILCCPARKLPAADRHARGGRVRPGSDAGAAIRRAGDDCEARCVADVIRDGSARSAGQLEPRRVPAEESRIDGGEPTPRAWRPVLLATLSHHDPEGV